MRNHVFKMIWIVLSAVLLLTGICLLITTEKSPIPAAFMGGEFGLLFVGLFFTVKKKW